MGAETETDGRGDAMKRKRYKLYDNYTTYFILLGLGFYYVLVIGLDVWAFCASDDVSSWIPFFLIITCPAVLTIVLSYKPQGFSRLLTPKASIAGARAGGALRFGGMKFVHMGFMGTLFPICPCRFCTSRWTRRSMHPKMAARRRESAVTGSFFSIGRPSGRR